MYSLKTPGNCPTDFAFGIYDKCTYRASDDVIPCGVVIAFGVGIGKEGLGFGEYILSGIPAC